MHTFYGRYKDVRRADPRCSKCSYVSSSKADMAGHLYEKHFQKYQKSSEEIPMGSNKTLDAPMTAKDALHEPSLAIVKTEPDSKSSGRNLVSAAQMAAQLGVFKMSDYLIKGTRQQFWEENFVKGVMQVRARFSLKVEIVLMKQMRTDVSL